MRPTLKRITVSMLFDEETVETRYILPSGFEGKQLLVTTSPDETTAEHVSESVVHALLAASNDQGPYPYVVALDQIARVNQHVFVKVMAHSSKEAVDLALAGEAFAISRTFLDDIIEIEGESARALRPSDDDWDEIPEWQ